ncbi:MAG: 3-ketoacyl-ACP reductase [Deltaproteobacteria bacterium]|nr:MAG: 3-ketoacyl-ACP reductase [Deltaproteobacteria bacterium]
MIKLKGKSIIITGSATGIGQAIAVRLANDGADLLLADINLKGIEKLAEKILSLGSLCHTIKVDVTNSRNTQKMVDRCLELYGKVDVAMNNAGVSSMAPVVKLTEKDWDYNMDINAKGIFLCCRSQMRAMIHQKHGKIINTASMAAKRGIPLLAHYTASKWAVVGFSKSLALEAAPHGITVNCICPGFVETGMQAREIAWEAKLKQMTKKQIRQEYIDLTPLGRLEQPEDVACLASFLASNDSNFMTGQAINITGGIEMG